MKDKEKAIVLSKGEYLKTVDSFLFAAEELSEKWVAFVDEQVNINFIRGTLMDETLQIITMIKSNAPVQVIAQTINQIPGRRTVLDTNLEAFINPEILEEIKSCMNTNTL